MAATPTDELEAELVNRGDRVLIVVGAGVSVATTNNSPCASWVGLLKHGIDYCKNRDLSLPREWEELRQRQLQLKEHISVGSAITTALQRMHEGEFGRWLNESIGKLAPGNDRLIRAIASLDVQVATTNYDTLIERITGWEHFTSQEPHLVFKFLRRDISGVWHIHGVWDMPDSVILGASSYEDIVRDSQVQIQLRTLLVHNTLLFVGCGDGLDDPNFGSLFDWSRESLRRCQHRHYILVRASQIATLTAQIRGLPISAISYGDDYSQLPPFIERLGAAVRSKRVQPIDRFDQLLASQAEFRNQLREVESQKASMPPGQYLQRIVDLTAALQEAGGQRSAWWSYQTAFEREVANLPADERIRFGVRLAEMMLSDGIAESAVSVLKRIGPDVAGHAGDTGLSAQYHRLLIRCLTDLCAYSEALEEIAEALKQTTDPTERIRLEAEKLEILLLQGDLFDSKESEGGAG
jgi:hypothetical protein